MHQIQFRLGLRPRPHWRSLQQFLRPSWIQEMLLSRGLDTTKEKGKRRKKQWCRQRGGDLVPLSSRQKNIRIPLNHKCKKTFQKIVKTVKNVEKSYKILIKRLKTLNKNVIPTPFLWSQMCFSK